MSFDRGRRAVGAVVLALVISAHGRAEDYHLGQGLRFDDIKVSGYLTVEAEAPDHGTSAILVDDLSLYVHGRFNRFFNPFFEAEIALVPLVAEGAGLFSGQDTKLVLERLYNDSYLRDDLVLRLGKSLTPVGEWNGIHAGPLVPTTTRPMTTYRSFSEFVSGVSLIYTPTSEMAPVITAYWQPEGSLSHDIDAIRNRIFHNIQGLNLSWNWGLEETIGFSLQNANITNSSETQTLAGFNAHIIAEPFEFRAEATYAWLKNPRATRAHDYEFGTFVQGSYHLDDQWSLTARYEYFQDRDFVGSSENTVFGMNYRPKPPLVWKLEYLKQWGQEISLESGVYASLAVLF